jgi:predicted nucleic acid-binding protein
MSPVTAIPLREFQASNWEAFTQFEAEFNRRFTSYSRSLPPRFYKSIRKELTSAFGGSIEALARAGVLPRFHIKVVIDTNIVVQDSLAVAGGKPSSTERILSSPFVQVFAPPQIREESERIIRLRAQRRGVSLDRALQHADSLLRRVKLVRPEEERFVRRASAMIGVHSPEDVHFMAVALEYEADAIVSRDRVAFDRQPTIKRWELRNLVDAVIAFESGTLSVVVVGGGLKALVLALQQVVVALIGSVLEILRLAFEALANLVQGAIDALAAVPPWGWAVIAGVLVGAAIYASRNPEFRERVTEGLSTIGAAVRGLGQAFVQVGTALLEGFHELLVWLWNLLLPVTATSVVVAGVLLRRVKYLLDEATRLQGTVPGI